MFVCVCVCVCGVCVGGWVTCMRISPHGPKNVSRMCVCVCACVVCVWVGGSRACAYHLTGQKMSHVCVCVCVRVCVYVCELYACAYHVTPNKTMTAGMQLITARTRRVFSHAASASPFLRFNSVPAPECTHKSQ